MDIRRLRHFLAIYDSGSLGQAAEEIHITQPALSKSLHQLEEEIGVKLFERTPTGVVPTVYGKALSAHVRVIQAEIRNAEADIASLKGATKGHLYVGIGPSMATHLVPSAVMRLRQSNPGITMTIVEGLSDDHIPALRRGELDLAIGTWQPVNDKLLASESLTQDSLNLYVGRDHPLAGRRLQLSDTLEYPWVLAPHSQRWRNRLDEVFMQQGLSFPEPEITSNSPSLTRSLLYGNEYIGFMPHLCIEDEDKQGQIVALNVEELNQRTDVVLTYRKRSVVSPVCHLFIETLRQVAASYTQVRAASERGSEITA